MSPKAPVNVLMVCLGNICRSPTAEAVFRAQVATRGLDASIQVDSAGTSDWHIGGAPDPRSQQAAAVRNYDLSSLQARQVQVEDFETFDYILAMDQSNYRDLLSICPPQEAHRVSLFLSHGDSNLIEVPDPYNSGPEGFELVLDLVENTCSSLLDEITRKHNLSA